MFQYSCKLERFHKLFFCIKNALTTAGPILGSFPPLSVLFCHFWFQKKGFYVQRAPVSLFVNWCCFKSFNKVVLHTCASVLRFFLSVKWKMLSQPTVDCVVKFRFPVRLCYCWVMAEDSIQWWCEYNLVALSFCLPRTPKIQLCDAAPPSGHREHSHRKTGQFPGLN